MVLLRYFLSILPALVGFAAFETTFAWPQAVFVAAAVWLAVQVGAHAFLGGRHARTGGHWQFAIPPVFLFLSAVTATLLVENPLVRGAVAVGVSVLVGAVSWNVYLYLHQPIRYMPRSLEHLSSLCNLLATFFGGYALFGLRLYLSLPDWTVAAAVFLGSAVLTQQSFWVAKLPTREAAPYSVGIPLLLTELAVALAALPVTHAVVGTTLAAASYAFLGMTRNVLRGSFTPKIGARYAAIGIGSAAAILTTARWA